jgi:hypothetical protein
MMPGMTGVVDPFGASRDRYLGGDTVFCVGNAAECDHYTVDGGIRIPWGGTPSDLSEVRDLALCPTEAQLRKAVLPAYLPDLVNLEALTLPAPLAVRLTPGSVGERVRTLVLGNPDGLVPAAPLAADVVLPGLRALMWVSSLTTPTLTQVADPLPPLEFLYTNVSKDVLRQLEDLPTLRHLELADLKDVDVFDHLTAPLKVLEIGGAGRAFPVGGLASVPTLTAVRLNGIRAEIDCTVFRALPELGQLTVLNSKKITNIDALLDCPKLASVTFVNCGNPFRKDGKARFGAKGFAHLDIAYS